MVTPAAERKAVAHLVALSIWPADYNGTRPHSKLNWQTPSAFASTFHERRDLAPRSAKAPRRIKIGGIVRRTP